MSTATPSIGALLGRRGDPNRRDVNPVLAWLIRYSPSQGWATLIILLITVIMVADSINAADWVDSEGLTAAIVWSAIIGLALAKIRAPWYAMIPAGLAIGVVVVVWQAAQTVEAESLSARFIEGYERLAVWWDAATTDGISTDLLPFYIALLTTAWIAGFLGSWFIFRNNNVWVAVVLLGMAVLTNLSFLPDRFASRFFLFVFLAMLLVVRVSVIQNHERWRQLGIRFETSAGWLTLHATMWFSILVLIIAVILPLNVYTNKRAADLWNIGRAPVATAEDFFSRMFAALPSKKDQPGRLFGRWLPFIGKISFGGEAVGWASTDYPSYWLSQTYNNYTSKGWVATDTEPVQIGPETLPPPRGDTLKRIPKNQVMQLSFESDEFLVGGSYDWVSREGEVDTLAPRKFYIHLEDDSLDAEMPADIQELAASLRVEAIGMTTPGVETLAGQMTPEDLLFVETLTDDSGSPEWVVFQRKAPTVPDIVGWRFSERTEENVAYSMSSYVSIATDENLREAGTEYEKFLTDHYLQLPSSLPDKVPELAGRVTEDADNPLDKALAIQEYLRGPEFTFSLDIEAPPTGADGVDWFLFDSKTGYSDYYASSMTVMLRSVGVPARMAAGYAPGLLNEAGQRVIRDHDSHVWTQVYFPDYGWIDFEPSPNWPEHDRSPFVRSFGGEFAELAEEDPDDLLGDIESDPFIEGLFD
ncbi:MAG: transglutaminase-like domain-containing protein, partial [Chloroflexota bacterium]|nr:transglutaminase-like domain-containing protein [Chloroflexota bacterium]